MDKYNDVELPFKLDRANLRKFTGLKKFPRNDDSLSPGESEDDKKGKGEDGDRNSQGGGEGQRSSYGVEIQET